jgi:hypothetical protein
MRTLQLKSGNWLNLDEIIFTTKNDDGAFTLQAASTASKPI